MADVVVKLRAIVWVAFLETWRRKVFYLVAILVLLFVLSLASQAVTVNMAVEAGEKGMVTQMHNQVVSEIFGAWGFAVTVLSLYLGAVAVSSEVAAKTLVNILSRPVERSTYLAGRWLGTLAFLWGFQLIGLLFALGSARVFETPHTPTLWVGCIATFVSALFFSGVSLGLSVVVTPVLAGAFAFLLFALPGIAEDGLHHPMWLIRALAHTAYYVAPAQMPVDLIGESFSKELVHPAYALYGQVLAENALYAVVVFAIACAIFARREIRLR